METNNTLQIARTYLKLNDSMPPLIIGYDKRNKPLALIGSFRDFQEQITFCAVSKMAFILNKIKSYHILTHGFMRSDLTKADEIVKAETTNQLIKFLGKNKKKKSEGDSEVIIDALISPQGNTCAVHKLTRNDKGRITQFDPIVEFDSGDLIRGMFTQLLPTTTEQIPKKIEAEVESMTNRIQYEIPDLDKVKGSIKELDKLWSGK